MLDCHARCLYSPVDQATILAASEESAERTNPVIAQELGTTISVIKATVNTALKARNKR